MLKSETAPKNGEAKKPSKEIAKGAGTVKGKSAAEKKAEEITKRLANFHQMQEEVNKREVFQGKLDEVMSSIEELKESTVENWEEQNQFKIVLNTYNRAVLTIGNKEIVNEFLTFIQGKIEKKIQEIDVKILALNV